MRKRIGSFLTILLLPALLLVTACGGTQKEGEKELNTATELRIAGGNVYFPYVIALEKGWFEEELGNEIKVTAFSDFGSGPAMMEAMTAGDIDVALLGDMPVVQVKANDVDVKVISSLFTSVKGYQLIAAEGSGIEKLEDIKGKTVAVMSGSTNHKLLLKYLEAVNYTEDDLDIVYLNNADQLAAFVGKNVDAAVTQVPTSTTIIRETGAYQVTDAEGYDTILTVIAGNNEYMQQNPEIIRKFLKVLIRANEWAAENQDEAIAVVSAFSDQDVDTTRLYFDTRTFRCSLDQDVRDALDGTVSYLYKAGTISSEIDIDDLIDDSYLRAIGVD